MVAYCFVHEGDGLGRVIRDTTIMSASERIFSLILDGFLSERRGRKEEKEGKAC